MRRLLTLFCCCMLAACSQWNYELGLPLDEQRLPQEGSSTPLSLVLEQLGPPQRIAAVADGYFLAWEYWQIREDSLGVSLGPLGVDLFSIDWGAARLSGEFLLLRFDRAHVMTDMSLASWDEQGGNGTALQPSIGIVDMVDVSDLLRPMPQHRWGSMSLRPLPIPLNQGSSPDSGSAGLEQRGTPSGAGQKTMEWGD
jgi:hypothetical protein